ncbi:MAG: DinB family protein [Bryobacteraceae bacterium]
MSAERVFLEYSRLKLEQLAERICTSLDFLSADQVWARGNPNENAVGNLVLHLAGNVRQWIGSGVGGMEDRRDRDSEFSAQGGAGIEELKSLLRERIADAGGVLRALPEHRLTERVCVQGYDVTVLEAVYHVVEHFSGHTGQILFATKLLTSTDLAFYKHLREAGEHDESVP